MSERTLDGLLTLNDVVGDAPIGDPDEEGLSELRELGRNLTNFLFQSLRILSIHDSHNAAVEEPLQRLTGVLQRLFVQTQTVHFITVEGQVYLNDLRIKMEASAYGNVAYLLGQLGRHGIGGITFVSALPVVDLKALMLLLLETVPPKGEDAEPLQNIRQALDENAIRPRGASTISQQVAKNLFLWPGRSLIRKGLEAGFTLLIEALWPKQRILEVYLNIAEFGPGIYGVAEAGEVFFHKEPWQLNGKQAARLAAVLPNPKKLRADRPSPYVKRRTREILEQMQQLGGIQALQDL